VRLPTKKLVEKGSSGGYSVKSIPEKKRGWKGHQGGRPKGETTGENKAGYKEREGFPKKSLISHRPPLVDVKWERGPGGDKRALIVRGPERQAGEGKKKPDLQSVRTSCGSGVGKRGTGGVLK